MGIVRALVATGKSWPCVAARDSSTRIFFFSRCSVSLYIFIVALFHPRRRGDRKTRSDAHIRGARWLDVCNFIFHNLPLYVDPLECRNLRGKLNYTLHLGFLDGREEQCFIPLLFKEKLFVLDMRFYCQYDDTHPQTVKTFEY